MNKPPVIILGAGLAGLACARRLTEAGRPFVLLEGSDGVGGRVRTDQVEGFRLDRGFQVLLTAYPECRQQLDYEDLKLKPFFPGAMVYLGGRFHQVTDPWRHPWAGLRGVLNPVGSLADKMRVGLVRRQVTRGALEDLWEHEECSTMNYLREKKFSQAMIESFFRPFLGGIFLEKELRTSSMMFEFIFRMMAQGDTAVPLEGMEAIPRQLARDLPPGSVQLNRRVVSMGRESVVTEDGQTIQGSPIVLAVDGPTADSLLGSEAVTGSRAVHALYYAADKVSLNEPMLLLNGEGKGPVNNACVISAVAPSYAPSGQSLISVSVLESDVPSDEDLEVAVRRQMQSWLGGEVKTWRHLRTYDIRHAQPEVKGWVGERLKHSPEVRPGIFCCGDYTSLVSIQGAMESGRRVAEALLGDG